MKCRLSVAVLLLSLLMFPLITVHAQGAIYLCEDGHGNKEYKNTGITKGCKIIDLPGLTTIPSVIHKPAVASPGTRGTSAAADFPRVNGTVQKARDNDRKQILSDEMRTEEQKLAEFRKEYNNGEPERRSEERNYSKYQERITSLRDDLARTEKNIDALKREISNLK